MPPTNNSITTEFPSKYNAGVWTVRVVSKPIHKAPMKLWILRVSRSLNMLYQPEITYLFIVYFLTFWINFYFFNICSAGAALWILEVVASIFLYDMFKTLFERQNISIILYGSLLISKLHLCVAERCNGGVHCGIQRNRKIMSQCATSYHNKECQSFKVAVLLPYTRRYRKRLTYYTCMSGQILIKLIQASKN